MWNQQPNEKNNMSATEHWKTVQKALGTKQDGIPGPVDDTAYADQADAAHDELSADETQIGPNCYVKEGRGVRMHVIGDDLFMFSVRGTCFGGANDPQDSGETASGISTKPPQTLGVALPRNYTGSDGPTREALEGSPIPEKLPWNTPVEITECITGKQGVYPFIDLGPNLESTDNCVDLTVAAAKQFDSSATATNFDIYCDVRIIGGAKSL
jgi:hypothetical protein